MLIQSGIDYNIQFAVLDPDAAAPCSSLAQFHCGKLTDYKTVMDFGSSCDIITIEIENVNTDALKDLVAKGKKVFPQPEVIALIQDKRLQKAFILTTIYLLLSFFSPKMRSRSNNMNTFFPRSTNLAGKDMMEGVCRF